jgi:hypothetical protein
MGNLGIRDHAALPADFMAISAALAASVSAETSSSNWSVTPSMEGVRSPAFSIKVSRAVQCRAAVHRGVDLAAIGIDGHQFGAVSRRGDTLPVADEAMRRPLRPRQCYLRAVSRPRSTRRICLIGAVGGHFVLQSLVDAVEDMLCHTLSYFALAHDN